MIGLRSYGQRDPLMEYKKEAFELFENLLNKLKLDFITILLNLKVNLESIKKEKVSEPKKIDSKYFGKKMSRNEPCFCGSGKNINVVVERHNIKYKNTIIAENPTKPLNLLSLKNFINKSNLPDV